MHVYNTKTLTPPLNVQQKINHRDKRETSVDHKQVKAFIFPIVSLVDSCSFLKTNEIDFMTRQVHEQSLPSVTHL